MLSSLQGGRKEKPLVVREEAHFNKALLSFEKGKQAEKHVIPTTWLCLHRLLGRSTSNFCKNYGREGKLLNCLRKETS